MSLDLDAIEQRAGGPEWETARRAVAQASYDRAVLVREVRRLRGENKRQQWALERIASQAREVLPLSGMTIGRTEYVLVLAQTALEPKP